ncbi:MAG: SGNH/GDSL hydrolase family protein [Bacteroidaceae bacterium]|nr:SGNH/GDSL hydrolase family protein [Bacteroidaceae bacterium]
MKKFVNSMLITLAILSAILIAVLLFLYFISYRRERPDVIDVEGAAVATPEVTENPTPTPIPDNIFEMQGTFYTYDEVDYLMYANDDAPLYPLPDESEKMIKKAGYNLPVQVIGEITIDKTEWCKVISEEESGFLKKAYLMDGEINIPIPYPANMTKPTTAKDVLFIGNSITVYPATEDWWGSGWGMGASGPDNDWVHQVIAATGMGAFDITSMRSWEFSKTRNSELSDLDPFVSAYKYKYVVIMLGENCNQRVSTLSSDLTDMITYIKAWNPETKVVLVDNFWPNSNVSAIKKEAATNAGASLIGLNGVAGVNDYMWHKDEVYVTPDGIEFTVNKFLAKHPNDAGYKAIADKVIAWFESH